MKNLFFIFSFTALLFGSSFSSINAQCSVEIVEIENNCGQVVLYASVTNPLNNSYSWNGGMNSGPVFTMYQSGMASVYVTCSNGQASEASEWINVNPCNPCTGDIKTTEYCGYTTLEVIGGNACVWNTGATTTSINVTSPGTYSVTATCQNGSSFSVQKTVTSIKQLNASVSGNSQVCAGEKTNLTANGGMYYMWSTGSNSATVNVGKGTYHVTVTGTNGCTAVVSAQVSEFALSSAPNVLTTFDANGKATFVSTNPSGNVWMNGTATFSTAQSITPEVSGIYTLKVRDNNGCYSASSCPLVVSLITKIVTVEIHDTVEVNSPASCSLMASFMHEVNGKIVSFKNTSSGDLTGQLWLFGDGTSSTEANPIHSYAADGNYNVTLFVFNSSEQSQISGKVFINTKTGGTSIVNGCNKTGIKASNGKLYGFIDIKSSFSGTQLFLYAPSGLTNKIWKTPNGPQGGGFSEIEVILAKTDVGSYYYELIGKNKATGVEELHCFFYTIVNNFSGGGTSSAISTKEDLETDQSEVMDEVEQETETRSPSDYLNNSQYMTNPNYEMKMNVYPNPTYGPIRFEAEMEIPANQPSGVYILRMFDINGRPVGEAKKVIKQE